MVADSALLDDMANTYRDVRRRVFEEATLPANGDLETHRRNQKTLRERMTSICQAANLKNYGFGSSNAVARQYADAIWKQLWTKIRYAGIKAQTATTEIAHIEFYFDDFDNFVSSAWDIESRAHELLGGGRMVRSFLNRSGPFKDKQTIGNLPKLKRTVDVARRFANAVEAGKPPIDLILGGLAPEQVWEIHQRLIREVGYGGPLTALHFMMELGLNVVKPDIVLTKLMIHWGWLQSYFDDVPNDVSEASIRGTGRKYGGRYQYNKRFMYGRVIDLAREILKRVSQKEMKEDIGWVTNNPIREFDLFLVKFGQKPEREFGIERTLFDEPTGGSRCQDRRPRTNPSSKRRYA